MKKIKIFDTTLRDGEQTPGVNFSLRDKVKIAEQLEKLGVDVIEGGFAIASPKNFEALQAMSKVVKNSTLCSLARANKKDIDAAYESIKEAPRKRIHTFIATSPLHMKYKLKMEKEEVMRRAIEAVTYAKTLVDDVEFSAEDACRSDKDFLVEIFTAVIEAGANVINIPDTVGYMIPEEYGNFIKYIIANTKGMENVDVSTHCHNDLGLATSNSLAAVANGATQIECAINGIGERAGNTALEEVVMAINTRPDIYKGLSTNITTEQITNTSKMVSYLGGVNVQPNKAIVGDNAFAHESGIHQHGVLENRETYEIITPESVGIQTNKIVLGSLSGRHAFVSRLEQLGIIIPDEKIKELFIEFKKLADTKKEVYDEDLLVLVNGSNDISNLKVIEYGTKRINGETIGTITLDIDGEVLVKEAIGVGPVDALYKAISEVYGIEHTLDKYQLESITGDADALCKVDVVVKTKEGNVTGRFHSTDIIEASLTAYLNALGGVAND